LIGRHGADCTLDESGSKPERACRARQAAGESSTIGERARVAIAAARLARHILVFTLQAVLTLRTLALHSRELACRALDAGLSTFGGGIRALIAFGAVDGARHTGVFALQAEHAIRCAAGREGAGRTRSAHGQTAHLAKCAGRARQTAGLARSILILALQAPRAVGGVSAIVEPAQWARNRSGLTGLILVAAGSDPRTTSLAGVFLELTGRTLRAVGRCACTIGASCQRATLQDHQSGTANETQHIGMHVNPGDINKRCG